MKALDRVRLLLPYGEVERPFFWFSRGKDGSIYAGVRKKKFTEGRIITKAKPDNSIRIDYNEGETLSSTEGTLSSKVSVHASGIVHTETKPGFRLNLPPLRGLETAKLISVVGIEHPRNFEPVKSIRRRDVVTGYPVAEDMPLWMRIYAAPTGTLFLGKPAPEVVHQMTLVFACSGLDTGAPNLSLQIDLCHGARGPWPPYSFMALVA